MHTYLAVGCISLGGKGGGAPRARMGCAGNAQSTAGTAKTNMSYLPPARPSPSPRPREHPGTSILLEASPPSCPTLPCARGTRNLPEAVQPSVGGMRGEGVRESRRRKEAGAVKEFCFTLVQDESRLADAPSPPECRDLCSFDL